MRIVTSDDVGICQRLELQSAEQPVPDSIQNMKSLSFLFLANNSFFGQLLFGSRIASRNCQFPLAYVLFLSVLPVQNTSYNAYCFYCNLSYNDFTGSSSSSRQQSNINLVSSHTSKTNSVSWCLMKDLPCVTKPQCNLQYRGSGYKCKCIEHSIFCFHTTQVGGWLETILSTTFRKKSTERKQLISLKLGLPNSQSAVCFALCIGAFSDAVVKVYTAANVNEDLEKAKREFLQTNIIATKSKKVFLPKLFERVAREASMSSDGLLK